MSVSKLLHETAERAAGHEVLNEVVLNQVLVSFGDERRARTRRRSGSERRAHQALRSALCFGPDE